MWHRAVFGSSLSSCTAAQGDALVLLLHAWLTDGSLGEHVAQSGFQQLLVLLHSCAGLLGMWGCCVQGRLMAPGGALGTARA